MAEKSVRERVLAEIARQAGLEVSDFTDLPQKFTDASRLAEDVGFDSLDMVELSMELENAFDTSIPDDVVAGWTTVGDVVGYVEGQESE